MNKSLRPPLWGTWTFFLSCIFVVCFVVEGLSFLPVGVFPLGCFLLLLVDAARREVRYYQKGGRMSRYAFSGNHPRYRVIVGWDAPLESFFAQVEDFAYESNGATINLQATIGDTPEEGLVLWLGADEEPITDVALLGNALVSYATIPDTIQAQLRQDQQGQ